MTPKQGCPQHHWAPAAVEEASTLHFGVRTDSVSHSNPDFQDPWGVWLAIPGIA